MKLVNSCHFFCRSCYSFYRKRKEVEMDELFIHLTREFSPIMIFVLLFLLYYLNYKTIQELKQEVYKIRENISSLQKELLSNFVFKKDCLLSNGKKEALKILLSQSINKHE